MVEVALDSRDALVEVKVVLIASFVMVFDQEVDRSMGRRSDTAERFIRISIDSREGIKMSNCESRGSKQEEVGKGPTTTSIKPHCPGWTSVSQT